VCGRGDQREHSDAAGQTAGHGSSIFEAHSYVLWGDGERRHWEC